MYIQSVTRYNMDWLVLLETTRSEDSYKHIMGITPPNMESCRNDWSLVEQLAFEQYLLLVADEHRLSWYVVSNIVSR